MTSKYNGFRYIYHYHIFNNDIKNFEENINNLENFIPNIANTHIKSFYSDGIGAGYIDQKIDSNQYKDELIEYAMNYYHINESNFLNFLGKDIYSNFTSFLLAPIIFVIGGQKSYYYMTLKIFKQGYFYIEIVDELDNLAFQNNNFNIAISAKKGDYILYPILNKKQKIEYQKKVYYLSEEKSPKIDYPITEYYNTVVENVESLFGSSTSDSFYTLFILDNDMSSNIKVKEEDYKRLVTAPFYPILGNTFTANIPKTNFNHFTIVGNIDRLLFYINSSKYNVKKADYEKDKLRYRAVNNAFILASLNYLYIKKTILKFKANKTYSQDIFDDLEQRYRESMLIRGLIQGYSINYLPSQQLREILENEFLNTKEFEEIQNIYNQYLLVINSKRQHKIDQKVKMSNFIIFFLTCLSIINILSPFINNKIWLATITTFCIIFILVIYVTYSLKIDEND
ncbi:TPA: hypothetical protein PI228_002886 [Staphylococcus aureus]|nr:hypothetical protein [Staphylococcus aureus]HDE0303725.1 hypothetical protein [Staphylococcus aureus]HDE0303924.1 hypothetical protein [Staphylococcus aureus]HDE7737599.1 hypothetical protein [Staphylococcus aureus]HDF0089672.1 hypothetical protein [Staphylococcus aureus]